MRPANDRWIAEGWACPHSHHVPCGCHTQRFSEPQEQRRSSSFIESVASVIVGLALAMAGQWIIFPLALGIQPNLAASGEIAIFMTALSVPRQYVMRRLFEYLRVSKILP